MSKKSRDLISVRTFIFSDILFIVIVLCCMLPYVSHSMTIAQEKTIEELHGTAVKALNALENTITTTRDMLMNNDSNDIAYLFSGTNNDKGNFYYHLNRASKYLRVLSNSQPTVVNIIMLFPRSEILIDSHGGFDSKNSFDRYHYHKGLCDSLFTNDTKPFFIPRFDVRTSLSDSNSVIGYCFATINTKYCNVCILLHIDRAITDILDTVISNGGGYLLIDMKGTILSEQGLKEPSSISSTVSTDSLHLEVFFPSKQIVANLSGLYITLAGAFALSILCGGIIVAINAYRIHRSNTQFTGALLAFIQNADANKREVELLQAEMIASHMREEDFSASIAEYKRLDYSASVAMLFTADTLSQEEYRHIINCTGDIYDRYVVAYGTIENKNVRYTEEMWTLLLTRISKLVKENTIIRRYQNQGVILLIPLDINQLQPDLPEPDIFNWSQSDVMHSVYNVRISLDQARFRHNSVFTTITFDQLHRLFQLVIRGESEKAKIFLLEMDNDTFLESRDDIFMILRMAARQMELPLIPPLNITSQKADDQKEMLAAYIELLGDATNQQKHSHNDKRKQQIIDYINDHFSESTLWAGTIAHEVGISEKYLYNFIKEQLGMSLGEYLEKIRMEKACKLLRTTDIPIKNIYSMCGYNSDNTFYKAFGRLYGMPPGEYRSQNREM